MPSREEAIALLKAHGHRGPADYLRQWRNRDGQAGGWDAALKGRYPSVRTLLWPGDSGVPAGHRGGGERARHPTTQVPAPQDERELRQRIDQLRKTAGRPTAFDAYWAVDWSARSTPCKGKDSIWWALLRWPEDPGAAPTLEVDNPATRQEFVDDALRRLTGDLAGERVLLGFDFPFGYPRGLATALGGRDGAEPAWRTTWTRLERDIQDAADNANNRFEVAAALNAQMTGSLGPFWGRPERVARKVSRTLSAKRRGSFEYRSPEDAGIGFLEWRAVDRAARTASSPWFVYGGANSVGGQALLGIRRVACLRRRLADAKVWPFETGANLPGREGARVIFAEIYPSLYLEGKVDGVKDKLQVMAAVHAFAEQDARGKLSGWFATPTNDPAVLDEEGWVLGVGSTSATRYPAPGKRRR